MSTEKQEKSQQQKEEVLDAPEGEEGEEEFEEQEQVEQEQTQNPIPQILPNIDSEDRKRQQEEIAYGCTFFSNAHGYTNPLNVVTPKAMQTRFAPINQMSYHAAQALLRGPYRESTGRNFADNKQMRDVQLQCLSPQDIYEIRGYKVSCADNVDFALESFKVLGAKDENDVVPVQKLASLLVDCYQSLDYQLECIDDYKLHCQYVQEQLNAIQETQGQTIKKSKEQKFELAPEEDIIEVIRLAISGGTIDSKGGKKDFITLNEWRVLYQNIKDLKFVDYREDIKQL